MATHLAEPHVQVDVPKMYGTNNDLTIPLW